jgi:hypothetical protein
VPDPLFLIDGLSFGVIALIVFLASTIVITIPVFATRGNTQIVWFLTAGFLLTVEAGVLITLGILVNEGEIFQ